MTATEGVPATRVKITPRVAAEVARRLRLAAGEQARSQSAVVNEVLDQGLPSLDEIRARLAGPGNGDGGGSGGGS